MLKLARFVSITLFFLLFLVNCKDQEIPVPNPNPNPNPIVGVVEVWRTNASGTVTMAKDPDKLPLKTVAVAADVSVTLDAQKTGQTMDGYGAALTGSSAFVLMHHLSASKRAAVLTDLFDLTNGIGLNYLRLTMGASDFSSENFTYNDLPDGTTDVDLVNFSIQKEQAELIPILKEIRAINPAIKLMASPWSAPAWMKSNKNMVGGGVLETKWYDTYAQYFVKYIQAMAAEGISIDAITVQNEPLYAAPYPSMEMAAAAQKVFIRDHLRNAFASAGITTKVIIYDHNWDNIDFSTQVLSDAAVKNFVDGAAFHCYAGDVKAMTTLKNSFPDKNIYFTECSGGAFSTDFGANLAWNSENLTIGAPRNWAKTVLFWNLALDQNSGPKNGGCPDCRGVVTVNSVSGNVDRNVEFYLLGHSSKFVRAGAVRLETPDTRGLGISQVAFKNTDGSRVVVAFNHKSTAVKFQVSENGKSFDNDLAAGSLTTFFWK
jgi:glucosylceramidase